MSRRDIYYWKCDRPAAFHGTHVRGNADAEMEELLREALRDKLNARYIELSAGVGQGNHVTWNADVDGTAMFIRVENGPEKDGQLAIESDVLDSVRGAGVPTPIVFACDATRRRVPFAWQALERIAAPDLNHWFKAGGLNTERIAFDIGVAVAKWQPFDVVGYGPLGTPTGRSGTAFVGVHQCYSSYFFTRLEEHLTFLTRHAFISSAQSEDIRRTIDDHQALLELAEGCLVHKDLALWNILGSRDRIAAFIDFDDSISGDALDDLSLLACFHDVAFLQRAFEGYESMRPLPLEHRRRFWLHLLRNMIVKAVIRVGAGYFERDSGFFLIGSGGSGADLKRFTEERLHLAARALREGSSLEVLRP
ncbi:MAG: aminoglycoside phosphotransferase family protein [Verrucomicrobiaceae bacterium]|nr:aminoglycoside phosphotransferase family protein [Verrucomicrobiaceae bacterium]